MIGDPTFEAACYRVAWTLVFAALATIAVALSIWGFLELTEA